MLAAKMANRVARDTGHRIKLVPLATQTLAHLAAGIPASALPAGATGDASVAAAEGIRADAVNAERAFFFGSVGRRMFGMVHHAQANPEGGRPILVAPPLLQEGVVCQRALWTLCESVAAHGGQAMRFDWYGTGDSAGGSDELTLPGLQVDLRLAAGAGGSDRGGAAGGSGALGPGRARSSAGGRLAAPAPGAADRRQALHARRARGSR
jgi:hypothetical protein